MSADTTFSCSLEEFKAAVAEFCRAAPGCDVDSLDNGLKSLGLLYFGVKESAPYVIPLAISYMKYAQRRYTDRLVELTVAGEA